MHFNPPPGWPRPPAGFVPPVGWQPDPSWPPPPEGWVFWLPDATQPTRRPALKPGAKWTGVAAVIIATALAVASAVFVIRAVGGSIGDSLFGSSSTTPLDATRQLSPGKYVVFQRTGNSAGIGGISVSQDSSVTLTPDQVVVTGPDGTQIATSQYTSNTTIDRNGAIYTAAVLFHVPSTGRYRVQVTTDTPQEVILTEDLGTALRSAAGWFATGFASLVLLTVGIVLLVRGPRRRLPAATTPPSGRP